MKKISAFILAIAIAAGSTTIGSCSKKKAEDNNNSSQNILSAPENTPDKQVEIKKYSFPENLKKKGDEIILSDPVYESFNRKDFVKKCTEQKFNEFRTVNCFGDMFYSYKNGNFMGLLNSSGEILFSAESYSEITAVSENLLEFYSSDDNKAYVKLNGDGSAQVVTDVFLNPEDIEISAAAGEKNSFRINCSSSAYVSYKDSDIWNDAEEENPDEFNGGISFSKCFSAYRDGKKFYICFDNFGNYNVYTGESAVITIKIGEKTGVLRVQDKDNAKQLDTLIKSFGQLDFATIPKADENSDYIIIERNSDGKEKTSMTLSPSGLCCTEKKSSDGRISGKYFTCYDRECFAALVEWAEKASAVK